MNFKTSQEELRQRQPKKLQLTFSIKAFFRAYICALKSKALFFYYPFLVSKTTIDFLSCLEKDSRIAGYKFLLQDSKTKIFLNYDLSYSTPPIPVITYYSGQGRTRTISVKELQHFQRQNPTAFTLIETSRGIMDLKNCLFYNCGGKFLVSMT
jgi:ribosomal protein S8